MAQQSKADRLLQVHREALEEFDAIQKAVYDVRQQCMEARRFYSIPGAQWEGGLGDQFENKPKFELNKVHLAVIRIFNEYRNNRITVDFTPKDGTQNDKLADTCDGLYRADEQSSTAEEAYDNGFEEAVGGGFGAWRLRACYEDEDDEENEKQRVAIEPIFDADACVFFNLDAKRQDKADAQRCYVLTPMSHAAFREQFGHDPADWPKSINTTHFDWFTDEKVWVCEHYRVEEKSEVVHVFRGLTGEDMSVPQSELDEDESKLQELLATGFQEVRTKRVKRRKVHKYILSGLQVEDDEGYIAGKCIPIVPVYGKRWMVDGVERCMGHVHLAMDAQRLVNMLLSWLGEMAARFDVEKPILTPEQVAGHAQMWAEDNIKKFPYLLLNPQTGPDGLPMPAMPMAYTKAPNIPPAMAALMQIAEQALQDLLGNQQAGEEMQPNMSGKAVELIQNRLDMQVFIYLSNMAKAVKRSGEIWLSMKKDITVEENRQMKTVDRDGKAGSVVMNRPAYDEEKAETYVENDLSRASLDLSVDVGPSSNSLRAAVVRALTGIASITEDPQTKQALTFATIAHLEGEGLSDLREWARRQAIRIGVVKPNDDEKAELAQEQQNQQPNAQDRYLMASAANEMADAALKQKKTEETAANTALKEAQTVKTLADAHAAGTHSDIAKSDALQRAANPPQEQKPA